MTPRHAPPLQLHDLRVLPARHKRPRATQRAAQEPTDHQRRRWRALARLAHDAGTDAEIAAAVRIDMPTVAELRRRMADTR